MEPQMNRKQVVAILEIKVNTLPGIKKFSNTTTAMITAEKSIALTGTCAFDRLVNRFDNLVLPPYESENNIRPVVNKALLHAEAAAVNTTKLIIAAADLIPIAAKTSTKGLWFGEI